MIDEFQNLFPRMAFILLRGIIFLGDFRCNANSVIFSSKLPGDEESKAKQIC